MRLLTHPYPTFSGPNWPATGEIDIVEGVNDYTNNQMTIHTNPGCNIPSTSSSVLSISGSVIGGTNCAAADTGNQGCGIRSNSNVTYGSGFNAIGGGVYASACGATVAVGYSDFLPSSVQLGAVGISIFFFPRGSIPTDIMTGAPNPSGWGTPVAMWPATNCNPSQFFNMHSAIFDTTLWCVVGIPDCDYGTS
jgi:hypothetical protein